MDGVVLGPWTRGPCLNAHGLAASLWRSYRWYMGSSYLHYVHLRTTLMDGWCFSTIHVHYKSLQVHATCS